MRLFRPPSVALLALIAVLAGCGKTPPPPPAGNASPTAAVMTTARLLKSGDFDGLMHNLLPPADYRHLRSDWNKEHGAAAKVSAARRARFAAAMQTLTAPHAEAQLFDLVRPQLKKYDRVYKRQMPSLLGIGTTVLDSQISNSPDLTVEQRQQATAMVTAIADWAKHAPWGDEARARRAIAIVVASARKLDLKTLDQLDTLDYAAAMHHYGVAWNGFKQTLAVYGFSLDKVFDSVTTKLINSDGNTARVAVHYSVLGKPMDTTVMLIRQDGHWYDRDILNRWRRVRAREQAAQMRVAKVPPAASSTAPAAASAPAAAASSAR